MSRAPGSPEKAGRVPAAGEAVVELLNTRPHFHFGDRLDDPGHAVRVARFFAPGVTEVPAELLEEIRAVRTDLAAVVTAPDSARAERGWRDFTARTSDVLLRRDFTDPGEVRLRQVAGDPVVGGIALAVAELVTSGVWPRVRVCAFDLCSGAFYDTTRSRTQRWHSYEVCGNRSNVAAYRARRAAR
ncbi:CGNR zinc finger domain-containing protein [Microtetraspora sp. NBRC 13810]|uniref:CGNR zinc finger domain-containing protein n=1 Tax=Microtetraspora sp. NBRC 13810 TaxID=3030990 RepID=UPI002554B428|nr:CGNR zinc finger domain-containing protein [Microtetraspora sp. NBRC 13810]